MRCPDVNILVYAHRRDEEHHAFYREWLERLVANGGPFVLTSLVAVAFVRIVTHPRFGNDPTPLRDACLVIDRLSDAPGCRFVHPGPRHWELARQLCIQTGATGKLVAEAQHAAVAMEHGARWVTRDDAFARFEIAGLEWEHLPPPRT